MEAGPPYSPNDRERGGARACLRSFYFRLNAVGTQTWLSISVRCKNFLSRTTLKHWGEFGRTGTTVTLETSRGKSFKEFIVYIVIFESTSM